MNNIYLCAIVLDLCFLSAGCGSAGIAVNSSGLSTNSNGAALSGVNSDLTSANAAANGSVEGITANPGTTNINMNAPSAGNIASGPRRPVTDVPSTATVPAPPGIPAPENSVMTTSMRPDGSFLETRVFNDDPAIAKLIRASDGKSRTVTVYLRSGKAVQIPEDMVPSVSSIPLARLRTLAGIKQTAFPSGTAPNGATSSKPRS